MRRPWAATLRLLLPAFAAACALHALLMPAYASTDFEVHRHWLALTHHLATNCWYANTTSRWTLDYPPLFAYFEWGLSQAAAWLAPGALTLTDAPVTSAAILVFQRLTVIASSGVLLLGTAAYAVAVGGGASDARVVLCGLLIFLNAGLTLVDNVHFQYNGMLVGVLFLCLAAFRKAMAAPPSHASALKATPGTLLLPWPAAYWWLVGCGAFAALVLFKQLFLVLAPLVAVLVWRGFLLPSFWTGPGSAAPTPSGFASRLLTVLAVVGAVSFMACAPVLLGPPCGIEEAAFADQPMGDLVAHRAGRVLGRLFPFDRGLVHAYWAPNVWAFYLALDRVGSALLCRQPAWGVVAKVAASLPAGWAPTCIAAAAASGDDHDRDASAAAAAAGTSLVPQYARLDLLPAVTPAFSLACVVILMAPLLWTLARTSASRATVARQLPLMFSLAYWCAFIAGWHVHEKAALYALLPAWLVLLEGAEGGEGSCAGGSGVGGTPTTSLPRGDATNLSKDGAASPELTPASDAAARLTWLLTFPAVYGLHPLLFTPMEQPLLVLLLLTYFVGTWCGMWAVLGGEAFACDLGWRAAPSRRLPWWCQIYLLAFLRVHAVVLLRNVLFARLPFLHLMLTSLYCALGIAVGAAALYRHVLRQLSGSGGMSVAVCS